MPIHILGANVPQTCEKIATGTIFRLFDHSCDDYKIHRWNESPHPPTTKSPVYKKVPKQSKRGDYIGIEEGKGFIVCFKDLAGMTPFAKKFTPLRMSLKRKDLTGYTYMAWARYTEGFDIRMSDLWTQNGDLAEHFTLNAVTPAVSGFYPLADIYGTSGIGTGHIDVDITFVDTPCGGDTMLLTAELGSFGRGYTFLAGTPLVQVFSYGLPGAGQAVGFAPFWTGVSEAFFPPSFVMGLQISITIFGPPL